MNENLNKFTRQDKCHGSYFNFQAWLNEKFSPDLLEAQPDIVDCVMEQLSEMEENIQRASKTEFKVSIHRMEVGRVQL